MYHRRTIKIQYVLIKNYDIVRNLLLVCFFVILYYDALKKNLSYSKSITKRRCSVLV